MKNYIHKWTLILLIPLIVTNCGNKVEKKNTEIKSNVSTKTSSNSLFYSDTTLLFQSDSTTIETMILLPKALFKGTILAFPGWNYPASHWCDSTNLCELASEKGYILILPTTGKTIYQKENYPETRKDWQKEVTRTWFSEIFIKKLQNDYNILLPEQSNYILGLSTGGRGALFVAQDNPNLFKTGASLSGDFDPTLFKKDNLYKGFFGQYESNIERWKQVENPLSNISTLTTPFYIGHGSKDKIVPKIHSEVLYEVLLKGNTKTPSVLHLDSTGIHNYSYWNSEIKNALDFFEQF